MCHSLRFTLVIAVALAAAAAFADGVLIPGPPGAVAPDHPPFSVKYHRVRVQASDQLCTTYVDQVFVNEGRREMEATYLFPLPAGAVVQKFTLHADGQEIAARLLTKEEAQRIYEDIVRRRKDPALLTYAGNNAYQARIFPIPAGGERRIELAYTELLPYDNGLVGYLYPLSTEKLSAKPIREVTFTADLRTTRPIGTVYSPSHDVSITRLSDTHVRVSYEESDSKPDRDVLLYYNLAKDPVGLSLITFKERGKDGFFLLLAAPTMEQERDRALPKHVLFVLDTSGSMSGEKIKQVQDALTFCVNSLNPQDKFNIIAFSDHVEDFAGELVPATEERVRAARKFISDFEARGATDIDAALAAALKQRAPGEPNYLVFLTDGQPTAGETDVEKILRHVKNQVETVKSTIRLFVFGVGYDVNTHFLDRLAYGNSGLSTYVRPSENIEQKVSSFFAKISQPVLAGLSVDYGRVETYDAFPRELPDLFHGSQVEVFGRYRAASAGRTTIRLTGTARGESKSFELACEFPETKEGSDYIASLWAARKIGYLIDQVRLHGQDKEIIDEIVKLSLEYGILTEYTAFLAEEDRPVPLAEMALRARESFERAVAVGPAGPAATSQSQNAQNLQRQAGVSATNTYLDTEGRVQRIANIQNVGQRGFVQRGNRWEDTRYHPDMKIALKVQAYSEAYFQLSRNFPALNSQLGLGDHLLVIVNGQAVEIGEEGKTELSEAELKALAAGNPPTDAVGQRGRGGGTVAPLATLGLLTMGAMMRGSRRRQKPAEPPAG